MRTKIKLNRYDVFTALHGQSYVLDGVSGTLRHSSQWIPTGKEGYFLHRLVHDPDEVGRRSDAYCELQQLLRDDWFTVLSDSPDTYLRIASELGLDERIQGCAECGEPVESYPSIVERNVYHEGCVPEPV